MASGSLKLPGRTVSSLNPSAHDGSESESALMCAKSQPIEFGPSEFTIEDLFDLVFPADWNVRGHLCMVYLSYLDDSKDKNQSKMLVAAGFFGTKDDWGRLRIAWSKRLQEDGLEYFKTSEYKMLTGQFAKFRTAAYPVPTGREKAKQIRSDLQEIMRRIPGIQGVGVAIPMNAYVKVASRPDAAEVFQGNPYRRALESVLFETVKLIRKKPGHNVVAFVHDDGPDYDELRSFYNGFKEGNRKTAKLMAGFQPLSDKAHPPLQAADMAANYTLELGLDFLETGQPLTKLTQMEGSINHLGIWTEHYMLSVLKRNLIRGGRPIPDDLQSDQYG